MKKLLFLLTIPVVFSSCGLVIEGKMKPLSFIDSPKDMQVTNKTTGEKLNIEYVDAGGKGGSSTNTFYRTPGVRFKPQKGTVLEFKYQEEKRTLELGTKQMTGLLIIEDFLSGGLATVIDLASGGSKKHAPRYVDVKALFENKHPRTQKELQIYMMQNAR